ATGPAPTTPMYYWVVGLPTWRVWVAAPLRPLSNWGHVVTTLASRWACSGGWRLPGSFPLARGQIEETRVTEPHPPYQETNCLCHR
ncbi:Hypothetical predicted protein, partial [Marmota monax]